MARRGGYRDRRSVGRSRIVPFRHGEPAEDRHWRRKSTNLQHQAFVRQFMERNGISMAIKNEGHHWIFVKGQNRLEWWPSSAKLIWNQQWVDGTHVHDYQQLIQQASRLFQLTSGQKPKAVEEPRHPQQHASNQQQLSW